MTHVGGLFGVGGWCKTAEEGNKQRTNEWYMVYEVAGRVHCDFLIKKHSIILLYYM